MRGVCGLNALCKTVLHRPRCSCPSCHIGRPEIECKSDPKCVAEDTDPKTKEQIPCSTDSECPETLQCGQYGQCTDPCNNPLFICESNKKCETRRHQPVCICKSGFIVNEYGELTCAPDKRECYRDDDCASNMACSDGKCRNPCIVPLGRAAICAENKSCEVQNHKPVCICMRDCQPSISICLRDAGCPASQACRKLKCVDPCEFATCAPNSPCIVEDHKPICKFCPAGFIADAKNGCQKGKAPKVLSVTQLSVEWKCLTFPSRISLFPALSHTRSHLLLALSYCLSPYKKKKNINISAIKHTSPFARRNVLTKAPYSWLVLWALSICFLARFVEVYIGLRN